MDVGIGTKSQSYYKCLDNLGDEMDTAETEIVCDNGQQVA